MSDIAIKVENLGKQYHIGARQEQYPTLRSALVSNFKNLASWRSSKKSERNTIWALKDVFFEVKQGEVVGVIGRNGAGKSTLLKVLAHITEPTKGRVSLYGRVGSLLEVGTGFHPELTGRDNIYMNGAILGMKRAEIKRKFDEIVEFAEIEKFLDTPVKRYSSGMYVRLAFAVAAHLEPEILVVDEVLAVGDGAFQKKCLGKMDDVSKKGKTVLFVSHNMHSIQRLCPRSILLKSGKLIQDGQTNDIIQKYYSQNAQIRPEFLQPHDPEKNMHLRRICLMTSSGEITNEYFYDQSIRVLIEYEVNKKTKGCIVWFDIRTSTDIIVFGSRDVISKESLENNREPGYYRTYVDLPARLLNAGNYYLVVGTIQSGLGIERIEVTDFSIPDIGTPHKEYQGILQPILEWHFL